MFTYFCCIFIRVPGTIIVYVAAKPAAYLLHQNLHNSRWCSRKEWAKQALHREVFNAFNFLFQLSNFILVPYCAACTASQHTTSWAGGSRSYSSNKSRQRRAFRDQVQGILFVVYWHAPQFPVSLLSYYGFDYEAVLIFLLKCSSWSQLSGLW